MFKALLALLCVLATSLLAITSTAGAQEPGVTVDPGSPSGKEYALPIQSAREQAAKKTKTGTSTPPLFGEGVNNTTTTTTPSVTKKTDASSSRKAAQRKSQEAATGQPARERTRALQAQAKAPGGGMGIVIGVGVAVLLVGGLIGLWLRRRATT